MVRRNTYAIAEIVEKDGLKVYQWTKKCPICKKEYKTFSRKQCFCSDECCNKAQTRKRRQQKEYNETKEIQRLSARSHGVAVATLHYLVSIGLREEKCACCSTTEGLEVHHVDTQWLNNNPDNLQYLCTKCHSKVHSDLAKQEKEQGVSALDRYSEEDREIYKVILK